MSGSVAGLLIHAAPGILGALGRRVFHPFVVIADQLVRTSGRRQQNMTGQSGYAKRAPGSTAGAGDDIGGLRRVERIGERLRGAGTLDQLDPQTVGGA